MRLFFDIGNTRLKWVLEDQGCFKESGVVTHQGAVLDDLAQQLNLTGKVSSVWASTVASSDIAQQLDRWADDELSLPINWVSVKSSQSGVLNRYADLAKLGVDRWMAVLGANEYRKSKGVERCPVIVVDAGTAVTIELLDAEGVYQGGVILPGLAMMHDSLVGQTQGIVSTMDNVAGEVLGQNTQQCVNSGVRFGLIGAIDRVVHELLSLPEVGEGDVLLLVTGGDACFVNENSNLDFIVLPQLVLSGLMSVANDGEG